VKLIPGTLLGRTALVIAFALIASQFATALIFRFYQTGPTAVQIALLATSHLKAIRAALELLPPDQREAYLAHFRDSEGIRVLPMTGNEQPGKPPDSRPMRLFAQHLRDQLGEGTELYVHQGGTRTLWVKLRANNHQYWVTLSRNRIDRAFPWRWAGLTLLGALLALGAAYTVVRRINSPIKALTEAAARIGRGESPPPIEEAGPLEIRSLSRTFNQMASDLQQLEADRALLLAGVSHDVRTPLARLRLGVEFMDEKIDPAIKQGMVQDIDDIDKIIGQFLAFAREGSEEKPQPGDLNALATDTAERATRLGGDIKMELADLPPFKFRPLAMRRLLNNLVENALRYGGNDIMVRTSDRHGKIILSVLDRGPGIPESEVQRLIQPFTRLDRARSGEAGAGLGLAIVDRIARMHHGKLSLLRREGGGLEARVEFPAA
jgi:two-component system, OmpR family, osmolarity sensor histidine kinase EnvZ